MIWVFFIVPDRDNTSDRLSDRPNDRQANDPSLFNIFISVLIAILKPSDRQEVVCLLSVLCPGHLDGKRPEGLSEGFLKDGNTQPTTPDIFLSDQ